MTDVDHFDGRSLGEKAAAMLRDLGGNGRVKVAIYRAAELAGLSYWRVFDLWYRKARRIEDREIEKIERALWAKHEQELADLKRRRALGARHEQEAWCELQELKARLAVLEDRLAKGDADFYRPHLDSFRSVACARG
jgi:hypothetical protein